MRISPHTIGDIHFGGNGGWTTGSPPLHGTSSMILHTLTQLGGGGGALFLGRPWDGARLETLALGSGSLFVSGSTKFGTKLTDTHQITGSTILSGSVSFNGYINLSTPGTFAIPSTTTIVGFDTTAGEITGSLFSATDVPIGTIIIIKDEGNNAGTNTFVLSASAGEKIEHVDAIDISSPGANFSIYSNGSNWFAW